MALWGTLVGLDVGGGSGGSGSGSGGSSTGVVVPFDVVTKAGTLLIDTNDHTWSLEALLSYYNEAVREVIKMKPNANMGTRTLLLNAGAFQTLPNNLLFIQAVDGNIAADGTTVGRGVTRISKTHLDRMYPGWQTLTPGTEITLYDYDPHDPLTLWVYPPADGTTYLQLSAAVMPEITATVDNYTVAQADGLPAVYDAPLVDYVLFRAYGMDHENPQYAAKSKAHYEAFAASLGGQAQAETAYQG